MGSLAFEVGAAVFGACVGSFLNVVIHRLPQEDPARRSLGGRSHCPACGAQIAWHDNVPVLGWLWLRGRARCCRQRIAVRYPLVETLVALLFLAAVRAERHGPVLLETGVVWSALLPTIFDAAFLSFLVACTFIDWDHRILPDALTKPFMALGGTIVAYASPGYAGTFGTRLAPELDSLLASWAGLLCGFGLTWGIRVGARQLFRKEAMGFGDVKFMGAVGAFVGWDGALLTFFLGSVAGAVGGVAHRLVTGDSYVPFGPFLAIGALATMFWKAPILHFLFTTWPEWQRSSPQSTPVVLGVALVGVIGLYLLVRRGRGNG